jgi:hypothetical protein
MPCSWTAFVGLSKPGSEVWVFTFVPAARQGDAQFDRGRIARLFTPKKCELSRQNKSSRTNLSPTECANFFIFEIIKLGGERAVSSLTNRRISLSPSAHASPCLRIQARQRWARHSVAGALSWSSQSAINTTQRWPKAGSHNSGKADAKRARREHAGPPVWPLHHNRTSGPCPIMAMERNLGRFAS